MQPTTHLVFFQSPDAGVAWFHRAFCSYFASPPLPPFSSCVLTPLWATARLLRAPPGCHYCPFSCFFIPHLVLLGSSGVLGLGGCSLRLFTLRFVNLPTQFSGCVDLSLAMANPPFCSLRVFGCVLFPLHRSFPGRTLRVSRISLTGVTRPLILASFSAR